MPIEVALSSWTNVSPIAAAQKAAGTCYKNTIPGLGEHQLDVENRLFDKSHHTTLEHWSVTFDINNIAVGDITLGLHLAHPFYNTDQRSGRFAAAMFDQPDFTVIEAYLERYWSLSAAAYQEVMFYINMGINCYREYLPQIIFLAEQQLKLERPKLSDKAVAATAAKIAQEQLRMFIPVIFPTGFQYTIDLITLASLYACAWTPALRELTQTMADLIMAKYPECGFMFKPDRRQTEDWWPLIISAPTIVLEKPFCHLRSVGIRGYVKPDFNQMFPIDLLHFLPEYMDNNTLSVETEVSVSLATMGQDQRHRTIRRSRPRFSGSFYLPPLLVKANLHERAGRYFLSWRKLAALLPGTLAAILAPYGAMMTYNKSASLNAFFHEQFKRTCWCAQEEIYHLSRSLRQQLAKCGTPEDFLEILSPPCYRDPKHRCGEGERCCGRDLDQLMSDPLPLRTV